MASQLITDLKAIVPETPGIHALIKTATSGDVTGSADFETFVRFTHSLVDAGCEKIAELYASNYYHNLDSNYKSAKENALTSLQQQMLDFEYESLPVAVQSSSSSSSSTPALQSSTMPTSLQDEFPLISGVTPEKFIQDAMPFIELFDSFCFDVEDVK